MTTQSARNHYFTIYTTNDGFFSSASTNPKHYRRYNGVKHFRRGNLTKQEAHYLKSIGRDAQDFREYIALALEEIERVYENP